MSSQPPISDSALPPRGTPATSIGSLPPIFSVSTNSTVTTVDGTVSETQTSEVDTTNIHQENLEVTQAAQTPSHQNGIALAVAETVPTSSTFYADFGDDIDDHFEDRAAEIARRVLDEIRMNSVQADAAVAVAEPHEPQSAASIRKELQSTAITQRQRISRLIGLATIMVVVVSILLIALVVVAVTTGNDSSSKTPAILPSERCSFCASGASSSKSPELLRNTSISTSSSFPTCADLYQYQQSIASTDTACPVLQAVTFYHCGCPTVPPRPPNATCTTCPDGAVTTASLYCNQVDAAVTIVGSSLFYLRNCDDLGLKWFHKSCTCPSTNATASRV